MFYFICKVQMRNSKDLFFKLGELGNNSIEMMRKNSFSDKQSKELRTWNLSETATLVKRTSQCIRDHEKQENGLPKAKTNPKSNKRFYTLSDINFMREYFQTCPVYNPYNTPPAVIAFTNFKGGVAKTTTAVHASQYFAKLGYKVLIVDIDSQASTTSAFGYIPDEEIDTNKTLLPFLLGDIKNIEDVISDTYWPNLNIIPANLALYGAELKLPVLKENAIARGEKLSIIDLLHKGLTQVYDKYNIIIIDCPPAMSILNTNALYAANSLVIPCPAAIPDIASMFQFFNMVGDALEKMPEKEYSFIRVLITKNDGSKSSFELATILRKLFGQIIMRSEMFNSQAIAQCRAELNSIYEVSQYKGSKQTITRATQIMDSIYNELEEYIREAWETSFNNNAVKTNEI